MPRSIISQSIAKKNTTTQLSLLLAVPSLSDSVMCYGPSVPDGYGVCYNLYEDCFNVSISSFFTSPQTSSVVFGEHLVQTLTEFKEVLEKS